MGLASLRLHTLHRPAPGAPRLPLGLLVRDHLPDGGSRGDPSPDRRETLVVIVSVVLFDPATHLDHGDRMSPWRRGSTEVIGLECHPRRDLQPDTAWGHLVRRRAGVRDVGLLLEVGCGDRHRVDPSIPPEPPHWSSSGSACPTRPHLNENSAKMPPARRSSHTVVSRMFSRAKGSGAKLLLFGATSEPTMPPTTIE